MLEHNTNGRQIVLEKHYLWLNTFSARESPLWGIPDRRGQFFRSDDGNQVMGQITWRSPVMK